MSLIDIVLRRRPASQAASHPAQTYLPRFEALEERQLLAVAAPTGVALAALSPTQVKVTWNDLANETGYKIFRWDGTKAVLVTTLASNVTNYTVSPLQPNQTHYFSVEARDATTTARSAWVSIATPANPITVPTNVRLTGLTTTSLTVQWNNATGATGYRVFNWNGTNATQVGTATTSNPSLVVNNLTPGVTYYFYVQAFNATNSANSDWASGTTLANGITTPANFKTGVVGPSTIGLSWNDVASETGYRVYRWDGNSLSTPSVVATLTANTTGYQAIGLLPGKSYWFYVQAYNSTSFANTAWVTATTVPAMPLQPPTQLSVAITGRNSVSLNWVEPARATGYRVFVWTGYSWSQVSTVSAGTHAAPITGLAANRTHWFFVQSFTDNFAEVSHSSAVFVNL